MDQQQALAERLKQANNILVTVSNNPSVDQLAACIGVTLALNKLGKHATAVFSGAVPSTIEFLQPEKTIEKNTDSLRDFIIALDKAKADKLRYKVEDKVVKIFITPYKTSINEKDFEFSQGDFNVDVVLALGVHNQADLDQAITSHGRILHDATVATVNIKPGGQLGTINWLDPKASSLSELAVELIDVINKEIVDNQIATALLTGIVAETQRFSNDKTTPTTMTISAQLMSAGANQQLVSTKLEPPKPEPAPVPPAAPPQAPLQAKPVQPTSQPTPPVQQTPQDGTIEISHLDNLNLPPSEPSEPKTPQIKIDEQGAFYNVHNEPPKELPKPSEPASGPNEQPEAEEGSTNPTQHLEAPRMILEPPANGGQLTANTVPEEDLERPAGAPEELPGSQTGLLQRESSFTAPTPPPDEPTLASFFAQQQQQGAVNPSTPGTAATQPPQAASYTLNDIEQGLNSPHVQPPAQDGAGGTVVQPVQSPEPPAGNSPAANAAVASDTNIDDARNAALQAIETQPNTPIAALNSQPLGQPLRDAPNDFGAQPASPQPGFQPQQPQDNTPPPPAPPPMMPPAPQ